ncbi:MAG: N4-(beta-N-acetylglucosaminyl)-L-asparaginase [Aureispira sp.]|jgi:N4-(beta-N-acetylglucosaminyl)-L-asparaginase
MGNKLIMIRRNFLKILGLTGTTSLLGASCNSPSESSNSKTSNPPKKQSPPTEAIQPIIISTWIHGMEANAEAWRVLENNGTALDAVEKGVMVTESDPNNTSVGIGGSPDREGHVTLDACIMDHEGNCGAVACLEEIENPIAVARLVMEKTPHVLLVGKGAQNFAVQEGFQRKNLLTENSKAAWLKWKKKSNYTTTVNIENHDTISMLAIDKEGNMSGACTTSGMAYKMNGRVGDSPIIGASLFVDNEIGGACATGVGEMVIRVVGSFLVVELMRQGHSPQKACEMAVDRIIEKHKSTEGQQVGFLALNKQGETGGFSIYNGFNYAKRTQDQNEMVDTTFLKKW